MYKLDEGDGEMAQWLRELTVIAEAPSSVPSSQLSHEKAHNLFWPRGAPGLLRAGTHVLRGVYCTPLTVQVKRISKRRNGEIVTDLQSQKKTSEVIERSF